MSIMIGKGLKGEPFYEGSLPDALRKAQKHAGKGGFVASMPQLLEGRAVAPFSDGIWKNWYTALSEENVGKTPQGYSVVVAVHGTGILGSPERIEKAYKDGLVRYGGKLDREKEFKPLLEGKLPDGSEIPVFLLDEFKKGVKDLPMMYAVVMDFNKARKTESGYQNLDDLYDNDLAIVRAGGREQLAAFLDKAKQKWGSRMGCWHPFNDVNPKETQGRLLFLDLGYGLGGCYYLYDSGRFVGVAPEALVAHGELFHTASPKQQAKQDLYRALCSWMEE